MTENLHNRLDIVNALVLNTISSF